MTGHPLRDLHWATRLGAWQRQLVALLPALAVGALAWPLQRAGTVAVPLLLAWTTYCAIELALAWYLALRLDEHATRRRARWNDPGAPLLFMLVTLAACASLIAVGMALRAGRDLDGLARWALLGLMVLSIAGAWLLIQTSYALHYARAYYRDPAGDDRQDDRHAGGLEFPGDGEPDYFDFLYFAINVGMAWQTADVDVLDRRMRHLTMAHGLLSFAFNMIVLALAVSAMGDSLNGP
jgi:uncharacterized membrane protein